MNEYGAPLERGIIVDEVGDGLYRVQSITRPGIVTPPIPALFILHIAPGDLVFFCMFDDGKGLIFYRVEDRRETE